jgi:hypothetical protein
VQLLVCSDELSSTPDIGEQLPVLAQPSTPSSWTTSESLLDSAEPTEPSDRKEPIEPTKERSHPTKRQPVHPATTPRLCASMMELGGE